MLDFFPARIHAAIRTLSIERLYEVRLRADKPLSVLYGETFCFLGKRGICERDQALYPTRSEVEETLFMASGRCVYAVENQLKEGFLTANGGERLGVAGEFVYDKGQILSVRAVQSLCVRIPHAIEGCGEEIYRTCFSKGVCSTLLMSPPGGGKTTLLRDLSRLICQNTGANVLVCDERGELSAGDLGDSADVIKYCDKKSAFTAGIRALRPQIIVTDELSSLDYEAVERAMKSGIKVIASAHLTQVEDVPRNIFSRYVLLKGVGQIGSIVCGSN